MDLPPEIDDYIKESIDYTLGLPVSKSTLVVKLRALEDSQRRLCRDYLALESRMKEKEVIIECVRAEATMNAMALKNFVGENQKLASECANLLSECEKLKHECELYDKDREMLMDFGNEADQRAKEAEAQVGVLEKEIERKSDEVKFYKRQYEACLVDSSLQGVTTEDNLFESVLDTTALICKDDVGSARAFLEGNSSNESCQRLLEMWNCLKPSTQKALSLVAELKALEKHKDHLRINLGRAEEEVKILFEENSLLDEENKKLLMKYRKEKNSHGSSGKQGNSTSAKSNKRKSNSKMSSPIEKKIDFSDVDNTARQPLSPLRFNSPDSRGHNRT